MLGFLLFGFATATRSVVTTHTAEEQEAKDVMNAVDGVSAKEGDALIAQLAARVRQLSTENFAARKEVERLSGSQGVWFTSSHAASEDQLQHETDASLVEQMVSNVRQQAQCATYRCTYHTFSEECCSGKTCTKDGSRKSETNGMGIEIPWKTTYGGICQ